MNHANLENLFRDKLGAAHVEIADESVKHAGHAQSTGGGHYIALIVSPLFEGKGTLERHRMAYEAAGMPDNPEIHALSLTTLTPQEWRNRA